MPISIPGDSASLRLVFECDSLNNVLLREISEKKSKNIATNHSFKDGKFDYEAKTQPDTVYIPSDTIYIDKEIPITVEVPVVEVKMSRFQTVFFIIGLIASGILLGLILIKIVKIKI